MKTHHRLNSNLSHFHHHQQHMIAVLIFLILFQNINLLLGHDIAQSKRYQNDELDAIDKRMITNDVGSGTESESETGADIGIGAGNGNGNGQLEEIFSAVEPVETNYDEYPMVVPKRAALLLDRLMLALHHAMEKENIGQRVGKLYSNKKVKTITEDFDKQKSDEPATPLYQMYSDDDPNAIMDYDYKDLNSINRATGESLMAKSFQRRANMGLNMGANGVALLTAGTAAAADEASVLSGAGGGMRGTGGSRRVYWRCYFNAVTCF